MKKAMYIYGPWVLVNNNRKKQILVYKKEMARETFIRHAQLKNTWRPTSKPGNLENTEHQSIKLKETNLAHDNLLIEEGDIINDNVKGIKLDRIESANPDQDYMKGKMVEIAQTLIENKIEQESTFTSNPFKILE
ncbi:hypothetical protein KFK09_022773 [Dendrobium nobile]|uniref:Uncharacterized protein n=1 Tax=Dendrobium nobile TaxID=94219 RepID=A0A8T3AIR1_DENNO|nr:hypothetical protein KFK09_022773 [Dendrobium nobile]